MKTAIFYLTHIYNEAIDRQLWKLHDEVEDMADIFVAYQKDKYSLHVPLKFATAPFGLDDINELGYRTWGNALLDGNMHLVWLDLFHRFPSYDYYWFLEYDVRFNGNWKSFFSVFEESGCDFVSSHIETRRDNPAWFGWNCMRLVNLKIQDSLLLKSFDPICRLSSRALSLLDERCTLGDIGNLEILLPTLFQYYKLTTCDIGNMNDHTDGIFNSFYKKYVDREGRETCTHRFRPLFTENEMTIPNMIYHPIK